MLVFCVYHTEHKKRHIDKDGDLNIFGRNIERLLGVYSTKELAEQAIARMRSLPGFVDEPDCFFVCENSLGEIGWSEGFTHG